MKKLKLTLLATLALLTSNSYASAETSKPAGFVPVSFNNYKPNNDGVFLYCDAPSPNKAECRDILIRGSGQIDTEYKKGKWRTADEYVKYKINDSSEFIDIELTSTAIFLLYKKTN